LTSEKTPLALIVDDDRGFALGLSRLVQAEGFQVTSAHSVEEARAQIAVRRPDIVLADLRLPDGSGADLLDGFEGVAVPELVLITAHASVETAVDVLRRGAVDYLTKPVDFARVKVALTALKRALALKGEIGALRGELRKLGRFGSLVGASPAMQQVYDLIERVAGSDARILISGETGSGKEVVAQAIHAHSRRRSRPFGAVNCGAISATLIESELFGHERGSFTGADRVHRGCFERADGGTLFLDEIAEMPGDLQVKLLRVLEASEVVRLGGTERLKLDVRIIAATNQSLPEAVARGRLREDLLYRLNVFPLLLPPLRERGDDVLLLAEAFLDRLNAAEGSAKGFAISCRERLRRHTWPGNVRELRNVVQRAFILAAEEVVVHCLPAPLGHRGDERPIGGEAGGASTLVPLGSSLAEARRWLVLATLDHFGGSKPQAAQALGISLKTLYSRVREYAAAGAGGAERGSTARAAAGVTAWPQSRSTTESSALWTWRPPL
jgi:DNA-binding NtrC family response regulator